MLIFNSSFGLYKFSAPAAALSSLVDFINKSCQMNLVPSNNECALNAWTVSQVQCGNEWSITSCDFYQPYINCFYDALQHLNNTRCIINNSPHSFFNNLGFINKMMALSGLFLVVCCFALYHQKTNVRQINHEEQQPAHRPAAPAALGMA